MTTICRCEEIPLDNSMALATDGGEDAGLTRKLRNRLMVRDI
jgi:hypothetical protein